MNKAPIAINRRGFISAGGALALQGCVSAGLPIAAGSGGTGQGAAITDCHAHFFNAADLPVAGFAKFVLIPRHFPDLPRFADALVDIIAFVAKVLALSASTEMRRLGNGTLSLRDGPDATAFGIAAERAHRRGLRGRAAVAEVDDLAPHDPARGTRRDARAGSHRALAGLLDAAGRSGKGGTPYLTAAEFTAIALDETLSMSGLAGPEDLQCPGVPLPPPPASAGDARTLLRWAYLMCRSRSFHVEEYLRAIQLEGYRVTDAINLLVDFDKWLNDAPRRTSRQRQQVTFWTRYNQVAATVPDRIRLHTFAGFDPLRDAEERVLQRRRRTTLATLKEWALAGKDPASTAPQRISGFKLYPPMGFRPDTNAEIDIPALHGGVAIQRRWGSRFDQIGAEIDNSLNEFFCFCLAEDIPVLAHARESNIALPEHGDNASPRHWLNHAITLANNHQGKRLRLCMGHFDLFNCAASPQSDASVLYDALRLNHDERSRIYFDLSFDDRILANQGEALMRELAEICDRAGDDGRYIVFGSDWIMLANQPNVREYLALARSAAAAVPFWAQRLDQLFSTNMRDFLKLGSG